MYIVDLDGTLVDHNNNIDERFVRYMKRKKTKFSIATGRLLHDIQHIETLYNIKCEYKIAQNGCIIADEDDNIIYKKTIPLEICLSIYNDFKKIVKRIEINTYKNRFFDSERPKDFPKEFYDSSIICDLQQLSTDDVIGMLLILDEENTDHIASLLNEKYQNLDITIVATSKTSIEIFNANASKGEALNFLKNEGLIKSPIIACGDAMNDIEMLESAEVGYAMSSSPQSLIDVATQTIDGLFEIVDYESLNNQLIVSCQALPDEPLHSSFIMGRMAKAAEQGGAKGIRCNSIADISEIKKTTNLPLIGIIKKDYENSEVYITPTMDEIDLLVAAQVDIIALDATSNIRPDGSTINDFFKAIKSKYPHQKFMADCSTLEEVINADNLGFDYVGPTLVGYTNQSKKLNIAENEFALFKEMVRAVKKAKLIAEGNFDTPEKAAFAIENGAHAVVVGGAITRPQLITKKFVEGIHNV